MLSYLYQFAIGLLASYPMAAILKSVPSSHQRIKHAISMCTGLLMLRYVYGSDWLHGVISSLVTYLICLVAPRKHVHLYVFGWAMGYMTLSHLYRMVFFYMVDAFDFTRTQMVLTMKLTSFAYNLYDGNCIYNNNDSSSNKNDKNNNSNIDNIDNIKGKILENIETKNGNLNITDTQMTSYDKRILTERTTAAIVHLPSPLEFGGFVFCFPNLLAGPAFSYKDYMDGMKSVIENSKINNGNDKKIVNENGTLNECKIYNKNGETNIDNKKDAKDMKIINDSVKIENENENANSIIYDKKEHSSTSFSSLNPGIHRLIVGIGSLIIFFIISSKAPIRQQYNIEWQESHSFLYRLIFISISFLGERFKFYFAWKVSEGSCILGGFGYDKRVMKKNIENNKENDNKDKKKNVEKEKENENESKEIENNNNKIDDDNSHSNSFIQFFSNFTFPYSDDWRGVENIDIISYEFGTNIQSLSRSWNKRTQSWLEKYVYQRTNKSLLCTYAVSALWHGLYPGYFLFFFSAALMSATERLIRTKINPLVLTDESLLSNKNTNKDKNSNTNTKSNLINSNSINYLKCKLINILYTILCWLFTSITLTYHAQTFYMKSLERSFVAFKSFYFIPNIAFILFYILLELAPTPKKINSKDKDKNQDKNEDIDKCKSKED